MSDARWTLGGVGPLGRQSKVYGDPLRANVLDTLSETVCRITNAQSVELGEVIQSLWSGYGVIRRATLRGVDRARAGDAIPVVIKHIDISRSLSNRRGWGGDASHRRKIRSYHVETKFYKTYSAQCTQSCKVPNLIAAHEERAGKGWVIVLEDLDDAGFESRPSRVDSRDVHASLEWLANFHAVFMGNSASELWPVGTYWHLETRPDEFEAMSDGPLKQAAMSIDQRLNCAKFQTLVHGDAKLANLLFSEQGPSRVAAVDFQYVGRGCGMKDVAYFISSCFDENEAASQQDALLDVYFRELRDAVAKRDPALDVAALEGEWRDLYPFAWADFCRFLAGWSPGHWKLNAYSDQVTQSVLQQLQRRS